MSSSTPLSRFQRFGTIIAVLVLHVAVLTLLLTLGATSPPVPSPSTMSLINVAIENPKPPGDPPPPPALPSKIAVAQAPPTLPSTEPPSPMATGTPGGGCATLASVSTAINENELAKAEILSAPPELQSLSRAVVIWNAGWSAGTRGPDDPLLAVRRVIEATLRSLDTTCLEEKVVGPRLIAIPTGDSSMYVVLGSGTWTWGQMLEDTPIADDPPDADVERKSWIDWF